MWVSLRTALIVLALAAAPAVAQVTNVAPLSGSPATNPPHALAAGCAASWIPTFGNTAGWPDQSVTSALEFDDGTGPALFLGGTFQKVGTLPASHVARWDGTAWTTLGSGLYGVCHDLEVFDDGSGPALYAAGEFTLAGGAPANRVAKWDGAAWHPLGIGVSGSFPSSSTCAIFEMEVFDDGSGSGPALYVTGNFTSAGGSPASGVARWNGTSWSPLGIGIGNSGLAIRAYDDGSGPALFFGGTFSTAGGVAAVGIAKYQAGVWSGYGTNVTRGVVYALEVFPATPGGPPVLWLGGDLDIAGGNPATVAATWDGTQWTVPFQLTDSPGNSPYISSFAVFDDGTGGGNQLYFGGRFVKPDLSSRNVGKWTGTAVTWLGPGVSGYVSEIATYQTGGTRSLVACGLPWNIGGGVLSSPITRWDGSVWSTLALGHTYVSAIAVFDSGSGPELYAAGQIYTSLSLPFASFARWSGTDWVPLVYWPSTPSQGIIALTTFDDGQGGGPKLYAGGYFTGIAGVPAASLAVWDGTAWSAVGPGTTGTILTLHVITDPNGSQQLYAGGSFNSIGGVAASMIARYDGTAWSALGAGMPTEVRDIASFDEGGGLRIFAVGDFPGLPFRNIARWDGTSWTPVGSGLGNVGHAMTVFDDGTGAALYVIGRFTSAGGQAANRIARWNGTAWSAVGAGLDGWSNVGAVFDDGNGPALYVGGYATSAGGVPAPYLARYRAGTWSDVGGALQGGVDTLQVFDIGQGTSLYVGGEFLDSTGGDEALARYGCSGAGPGVAECFGDGSGAACPCSNLGGMGNGCANSVNVTGANLKSSGTATISSDTVVLTARGMPNASALYFQGTTATSSTFGDGLLCTAGAILRLGAKPSINGSSQYPEPGDASIHVRGRVFAGGTRLYQVYYRDAAAFCTTSTFNLTNVLRVLWTP
jgi:trimeric autotransporter adhesin